MCSVLLQRQVKHRYDFIMLLQTLILLIVDMATKTRCQVYDDTHKIFNTVLGSSKYNVDVRPVINQSEAVQVYVGFELLSIVEVNDVTQSFVCNGIVQLAWKDERAAWNVSDYGGVSNIHPHPKNIWRPRTVLVNTLGKRDLFEDDFSPMHVDHSGWISWFPGSLFPTSCKLDLTKYPFDEQYCSIEMLPMALRAHELLFTAGSVHTRSYTINGAWEIVEHQIYARTLDLGAGQGLLSQFEVGFRLRRRPTFFLLNILLPVVLLSLLNILVFVIPVASGEKISYSITVLLALTVFISIVSSMLPQSSDNIPLVVIYLFCLLVVSLLTVVVTIVIVFLHHMEAREERSMRAKRSFKSAIAAVESLSRQTSQTTEGAQDGGGRSLNDPQGSNGNRNRRPPQPFQNKVGNPQVKRNYYWEDVMESLEDGDEKERRGVNFTTTNNKVGEDRDDVNKYKMIGKYIDMISFFVFTAIWIGVTLWIFIRIST